MSIALVYVLLALIPLAIAWRGRQRRWLLLGTPAIYVVVLLVGVFLARFARLPIPPFVPFHPTRAAMGLIGLTAHGFLLWFPLGYLVVALLLAREGARRAAARIAAACIALFALGGWGFVIEPSTLRVRSETVRSTRAPARPLRILHVSDLQTDGPCRRERAAAAEAEKSDVDLAIVTGDLANDLFEPDRPEKIRAVNTFLRSLRPRHGAFLVRGDWDGWEDDWADIERAMLEGTEVRVLSNESARMTIDGTNVLVYGVEGGAHHDDARMADLRDEGALRIVAVHHPDFVARIPKGGADLVLAGHTHGGQIVLPIVGALVTHSDRGFVGGLYTVDGLPLVVSRGIGMRGGPAPRARLGCPPELGIVSVTR